MKEEFCFLISLCSFVYFIIQIKKKRPKKTEILGGVAY
jgi:hypothetical protein